MRNILYFPNAYPDTKIIALEQNYRSTQPILDATNRVIGLVGRAFRQGPLDPAAGRPIAVLLTCEDEDDQADYVIRRILEHREAGIALRRQAVLFRASHHSMMLEAELAARHIPFHKYGGLKFVETAHVKDLLAFLRLAENPRRGGRGADPAFDAGRWAGQGAAVGEMLAESGGDFSVWTAWKPPAGAAKLWPELIASCKPWRPAAMSCRPR